MKNILNKDSENIVISGNSVIQVDLIVMILERMMINSNTDRNDFKSIKKLIESRKNQALKSKQENESIEFLYTYRSSRISYNRGTYLHRKFFEDVYSGKKDQNLESNGSSGNFFRNMNIKEYKLIKCKEFVINYGKVLFKNDIENLNYFLTKFKEHEDSNIIKLLKQIKFYDKDFSR